MLHSSYGSSGDDCCFKYCYDSSKFHPTTFTTCIVPPTDSHDAIGNERKRRDGCWKYGKLTVTNDDNNINNINKNNYNINNNNANISKFYYNIVLPSTSSSSSSLFSARRIVTFLNLHKKINVILLITTIFLFVVNYSLLFTTVIVFILFGCVN